MPEPTPNFFVVRLPDQQFQAANGAVDSFSKANQFPTLQAAYDAASEGAKGISEYTAELSPVRHLALEDAEQELTQEEE